MSLCMCLLISVNYQDGSVKAHREGNNPFSVIVNFVTFTVAHLGTFICVANCCPMNSRKTKSGCIHANSVFLGRKEGLALA